jgi:prophage regulatory protein
MNARPLTFEDMQAPGRVLIKRQQLLRKVPLADRTIFDMEQRGEFPQRFSITSRLVAWDLQEVDEWIAKRQEAAGRPPAPGYVKL